MEIYEYNIFQAFKNRGGGEDPPEKFEGGGGDTSPRIAALWLWRHNSSARFVFLIAVIYKFSFFWPLRHASCFSPFMFKYIGGGGGGCIDYIIA